MNPKHPRIKNMINRFGSEELAQYWYSKNEGEALNDGEIDEILGENNTDEFPSANDLMERVLLSDDKITQNREEITIGNKSYKKGVYSFKEIFENIGEKSYANKLLKMLYNLSNQNIDNIKIEIVDDITEAGHFVNENGENIIRININTVNGDTVFTHEVIHALTALKLAYWKKNSPKVYKDMEKIWIDSKAVLDPNNERYEFSSLDEFYAALSKQSFVEELATIKDDSFLGKLIQLFKDMLSKLGVKIEGTLAERALNNLSEIVQTNLDVGASSYLQEKLFSKSDEQWNNYLKNKKPTSNQLITIGKLAEIEKKSKYDDVKKVYFDTETGAERTRVSNIVEKVVPFEGTSTEEIKENSAALGDIFDGIFDDLIANKPISEIEKTYTLSGTMVSDFIKEIQEKIINNPEFKDCIFISQHGISVDNLQVTTQEGSDIYNLTGTTDVLAIHPNGEISIIDLKTASKGSGAYKLKNEGQPITQQYIYKTMYELNGLTVKDASLFIKELEKNENQSEVISTTPAELIPINSNLLKPSSKLIDMTVVSVVDDIFDFGSMSTEEADELEDEINSDVIEVKKLEFWKEVEKELEKSASFLESSTSDTDAKMIYRDFRSTSKYYKKRNEGKKGEELSELEKVVNQAATLAIYVGKLKHQLITKPSSEGTTSFNTLIKKPLLEIAKIINENSQKPMTYEQNEAYVEMSNYIKNFIKDKNSLILELKQVLKESANQQLMINAALQNESVTYYSALKDIEEVLDVMTQIHTLLKDSNHLVKLISIGNEAQLNKALTSEQAQYERQINKINEKMAQRKAKITPENKEEIEAEIKELEESKPTPPESNVTLNVAKELEDGTDGGLIVALFGTINDFGDKSLTLLRNRIEDAFKDLQKALAPIGKVMTDAWKEFNGSHFNMNDDSVFEGFTEIVEYVVKGVKKTELHFVTNRDLGKYYRELNETADKIAELKEQVVKLREKKDYRKGIKPEQVAENKRISNEIKALYKQMNDIEDAFDKKQAYKQEIIAPNKTTMVLEDVHNYLIKTHDDLISLMGVKDGSWAFTQFMRENYNLNRMMFENNYIGVSDKDYVLDLVANKFARTTLRRRYSSTLTKPMLKEYPSDKLDKLTPEQRKMYDVLTSTYYEAQKNLPEHLRPKTRVPSVSKDIVQKFMNKDSNPKELFNEMLSNHFSDELENGTDNRIPVYYTSTAMQPHEISKNLVSTVLLFTKQAMAYKTKAKTLHIAQELQNAMGKTKKQDSSGRQLLNSALKKIGINQAIPVGSDWRNWFLDLWIDQVFYGKTNRPIEVTVMGKKIRIDKILQKLAGFSAFGTLGGVKVVSHLTNISMANASNLLESTGYFKDSEVQPLFTKGQYLSALASDGWKTMLDMLVDYGGQTEYSNSVYAELIDELEPLQGEYFDRFGTQLNKNFLGKMFSGSTWFAPMHLGDVQPQVCAMIATLSNMEVTVKGEKTNLWKALTATNNLEENWKTVDNVEDVKKQLKDNKRKLDELNKKMHGNYQSIANVDRPISRQSVVGQLFEMYRKFIVPGMLLRWDKGHHDLQRDEWVEGRYRTLFSYIINDMRWMLKAKNKITPLDVLFPTAANINEIRKYYSDSQIVNIRKAVVEQMFITCTSLLAVLLYGLSKGGDDDDEVLNYTLVTSASVIFRVSRDFSFFTPISVDSPFTETWDFSLPVSTNVPDILRIGRSPFAVQRTVNNIQDMITLFTSDPSELYKVGEYKGESKLKIKVQKLLGLSYGTDGKAVMEMMYEKTN